MATVLTPVADPLFERWGYQVSGWFNSPYELEERPGVFVIATHGFRLPFVLDVSESNNVRFCVLGHERRLFWRRNALGGLLYAAIYTEEGDSEFLSEFERRNMEQHIRSMEQPAFGAHDLFARSQPREFS
jgi:hypothetical protein